jgi:tetrahydromethanopterin S-methyltransferase subunit E
MGKIIPTLDRTRLSNLESLYTAIKNSTIKNKFVQAGILAVCAKESGFAMVAELDWRNTKDPKYIRSIFGSKLAELTDTQILKLKSNIIIAPKTLSNINIIIFIIIFICIIALCININVILNQVSSKNKNYNKNE